MKRMINNHEWTLFDPLMLKMSKMERTLKILGEEFVLTSSRLESLGPQEGKKVVLSIELFKKIVESLFETRWSI